MFYLPAGYLPIGCEALAISCVESYFEVLKLALS